MPLFVHRKRIPFVCYLRFTIQITLLMLQTPESLIYVYIHVCIHKHIHIYIIHILTYSTVADAFRFKKSSSALLVHEQQAPQNWCLSSSHSTACGDYKRKIYENTSSVCKTGTCMHYTVWELLIENMNVDSCCSNKKIKIQRVNFFLISLVYSNILIKKMSEVW